MSACVTCRGATGATVPCPACGREVPASDAALAQLRAEGHDVDAMIERAGAALTHYRAHPAPFTITPDLGEWLLTRRRP